jgi:hypothetical protein
MNYLYVKKNRRQKISSKPPYWNFWRVVFAGWLVRYPKQTIRIIGIPVGILLALIYNALKN